MTTECTTERLEFGACEGSESSVDLTVGELGSDGGGLLLRAAVYPQVLSERSRL